VIKKIWEKLQKTEKSNLLKLFLVSYIFFLGFFLTSKMWYPESTSDYVPATEIGKKVTFRDRDFTLKRWDYSEKQSMMEIEFQVLNHSTDGIKNLYYEAMDIKEGYLQTETVFEESNLIVVRIKDIPDKWSQISLRIKLSKEDESVLKYYTNKEKVNSVQKIEDKSKEEYLKNRTESDKKTLENDIEKQKTMISEYESKIDNANENISELMASKKYQTEDEQLSTDEAIHKLENDIVTYQEAIAEADKKIQEYQQKIKQAEEKITEY